MIKKHGLGSCNDDDGRFEDFCSFHYFITDRIFFKYRVSPGRQRTHNQFDYISISCEMNVRNKKGPWKGLSSNSRLASIVRCIRWFSQCCEVQCFRFTIDCLYNPSDIRQWGSYLVNRTTGASVSPPEDTDEQSATIKNVVEAAAGSNMFRTVYRIRKESNPLSQNSRREYRQVSSSGWRATLYSRVLRCFWHYAWFQIHVLIHGQH